MLTEAEQFSSDSDEWFDKLAQWSKSGQIDPALEEMYKIATSGKYTDRALERFGISMAKIKDKKIHDLFSRFWTNIVKGKYDEEFGALVGNEYSMVGELFSLFRQAYEYYR